MEAQPLIRPNIDHAIERNKVGNYWLGNYGPDGSFRANYVGRSDTCLRRRLHNHAATYKFQAFIVRKARTIKEAFEIECREWHLIGKTSRGTNAIHPRTPRHLRVYKCPYCEYDSSKEVTPRDYTT